ncbi:hypothetical protein BDZ91DRAFT_711562 [Kalaharituber pfeilii]|nr:hypothetical protein BDZ91DRAFT_711562 [Kalaharituber pfeilii]
MCVGGCKGFFVITYLPPDIAAFNIFSPWFDLVILYYSICVTNYLLLVRKRSTCWLSAFKLPLT